MLVLPNKSYFGVTKHINVRPVNVHIARSGLASAVVDECPWAHHNHT
jgi:hypothetical protein